jgi:hypothetical protein
LGDAKRLDDIDHAERVRPGLQRDCREHRAATNSSLSDTEQPDARDRRS